MKSKLILFICALMLLYAANLSTEMGQDNYWFDIEDGVGK